MSVIVSVLTVLFFFLICAEICNDLLQVSVLSHRLHSSECFLVPSTHSSLLAFPCLSARLFLFVMSEFSTDETRFSAKTETNIIFAQSNFPSHL